MKTITVSKSDLMWLAGLIEGDGCFYQSKGRAKIQIEMIDKDVIERASKIMSGKIYNSKNDTNQNWKKTYTTWVSNNKALTFMQTLKPYMSKRRQKKIEEILNACSIGYGKQRLISCPKVIDKIKEENQKISCRKLAKKYGVSHETIRKIVREKHVNAENKKTAHEYEIEVFGESCNLSWASGVLEAEGSFKKGCPSAPNATCVSIQMSDRDVMERISEMWGLSLSAYSRTGKTKSGGNFKEIYCCSVRGGKARKYMEQIKCFMGVRRQKQIDDALNSYDPDVIKKTNEMKCAIPEAELKFVNEKIVSGLSYQTVAEEYGVTRNVIRRCLQRYQKIIDTQK